MDQIIINSIKNELRVYKGKNPYITSLKEKELTEDNLQYILKYINTNPITIKRVITLEDNTALELKNSNQLSFTPKRMLVESVLVESDNHYQVWGKLNQNQPNNKDYRIKKDGVVGDIYFEESEIDVDFDKYVELSKQDIKLYEHQESAVKFLLDRKASILADDMGLGKAEFVGNQVFTPFGRKRIGDIKPGDFVIGSDGKPTLVEAIYPQGKRDLYRVTFNDGYSVLVDKEHLFTVTSNNGSVNYKNRGTRYTTLSVGQMLDKGLVLEQRGSDWNEKRPYKFKTYYKQSNSQNKWQIPIVKPIQFENNETLLIDPYLLGVSLGDGHIKENNVLIGLHIDDFDEFFVKYFNDGKTQITEYAKPSNTNTRICNIKFDGELNELNLNNTRSHTKFIPDIYKYSSIENRIAILQGLMDTDGYCMKSKNGEFTATEYCTVSEQLADDVTEIVHSLGGVVRKHSKIGSYKKEDGTKVICKKAYRLNIKFSNGINPFRLKRKADLFNQPQKYKVGRYIKNIEFETNDEAVCIQVEAEDHLYITEHGIVTHNTKSAIVGALESAKEKILVICPASLKLNWEHEINDYCDNTVVISNKKWKDGAKFTIINYDILKNFHTPKQNYNVKKSDFKKTVIHTELKDSKFDLVIIDEAHKLKNDKSIRGKVMADLCDIIPSVWLLTGTPITSRPIDYYNLLKLTKSHTTLNWDNYVTRYCDGKQITKYTKWGKKQIWVTDGASNLHELHLQTKNNILRRMKGDVLDMPEKTLVKIPYVLTKKEQVEYDQIWDDYLEDRRNKGKSVNIARDVVELGLMRKFIAMTTIEKTIERAESAIEQGHKVIIFVTFTDELEEIYKHFGKQAVKHNGKMTEKQKQKSVDDFQTKDKINVFVGNVISAGVGITLTEATIVIFNSFSWVPGDNNQCEDRCIFSNQLVLTNGGYTKIQDISIGDLVYTHKGNFKPVSGIHTHLERKKLRYDINGFGFNNELSVTCDHEIYVYNKGNNGFEWVEAKNININKHLLTLKSNKQPTKRKSKLLINVYVNDEFIGNNGTQQKNGRLIKLDEYVELTNDLLYAFGFFIADGWTSTNKNKSSTVNVCQKITNKKMYDASEYIIDIFKKSFGFTKHSSYIDVGDVKTCTIYSRELALNFKAWFGYDVYNKQLPSWVTELNDNQLISLLDGYYHGDGYQRGNTQQATTASSKLATQLVIYNINLGRSVSFTHKSDNHFNIEYTFNKQKNKKINIIGEYITYPIKSILISKPKRGDERVYDLTIDDDHSFVVGNYNVHNCHRIGQKNNVTIYYQLYNNTITTLMWGVLNNKTNVINTILNGDKHKNDGIIIKSSYDRRLTKHEEEEFNTEFNTEFTED